jgi:hypothetical protein
MNKKKVLILCYSNVATDPRVQRQIAALRMDYSIEVCATGDSGISDIPFYPIYVTPPRSLIRKMKRAWWLFTIQAEAFYWDARKKKLAVELSAKNYDVVIANDIATLPLALRIADKRSKVYFDAHEYHPEEWTSLEWKLFYRPAIRYLCKKYIPKVDCFSTVTESIAEAYKKFIGIKPIVITNAGGYQDLHPTPVKSVIELVHHGAAIRDRKLERMIDMMEHLDNYILYLMLTPVNKAYLEYLKKKAGNKVKFIPPVPQYDVCKTLNQFDIGVYILPPTNFNNLYALPNKIYDFIQARLCVAVSPNPEIKNIVKHYDLGVVSDDFSPAGMAAAIRNLAAEKILFHKEQSHMYARALSADRNVKKINELVTGLFKK